MNTDETVGFGIVGTGVVADFHRRAIKANADKGARLIAVSTRDPAKYRAAGKAFGVDCISFEALCRHPQIDVICICTPSGYHADQAIAVAQAGKHARWDLADAADAVVALPVAQVVIGAGAGGDPKAIPISGHVGLISNFMDAMRGKGQLFIDAKEGRRSLAAVLGVYSAAELISTSLSGGVFKWGQ